MGTILKVVCIPRGSWHDLEEVLLEEMTVFRVRNRLTRVTSAAFQEGHFSEPASLLFLSS